MLSPIVLLWSLRAFVAAQTTTGVTNTYTPLPTLASSYNWAPSVTPNILDATAPDAQEECPGYTASNVVENSSGFTADLTLAGDACHVYGNDISDLLLAVSYQSKARLSVKIYPKYVSPSNYSQYVLSPYLTPLPGFEEGSTNATSDLRFEWSNDPSFQFRVSRTDSGEVLFDTYGHKIVFEDQFLELVTAMVPEYNLYGLAESITSFRHSNNYTQTMWNAYNLDNDAPIDTNLHSTHPVYIEIRYGNGSSTSHGVYGRNAHGQEWLLHSDHVTYRTIGGSFDFYFVSGPTPKEVISQYQVDIVGTPVMQTYWSLGFHQVRWSYHNWSELQMIIDGYANANIQLEGIWNDLDYLYMDRDFTNDPIGYPLAEGQAFLKRLHANGQYWMPILDPQIYVPDPSNATDAYATYDRGAALGSTYIENGDQGYYIGDMWPGLTVFVDFFVDQGRTFWADEFVRYHALLPFDGFWVDVSDAVSWCTGSCGTGQTELNPVHVPFPLPGDPGTRLEVDYRYPEAFNITNATEAASASASLSSLNARFPTDTPTPTPTVHRTLPTPGVRNLTFPPYALNNWLPGHALVKNAISPNATHNDEYNSTEYDLHNLYGHTNANATYQALLAAMPGKRPFFLERSTFAGSGSYAGHWGGDSNSMWANMYFTIGQALQMSIVGIAMFGPETCGFNGNADMELCTRWMELSAFFTLYRNHNNRNTIPQEAFRWATTAEATRRAMDVRFRLLPYTYTLFYRANQYGETVVRALQFEFPNDASLAAVETQFLLGPSILITPVLVPLATSVQGVFPGVGDGEIWYDWYTLRPQQATAGQNVTLDAPLEKINVHLRGGTIIAQQTPGNTTRTTRQNPWSLVVALDGNGEASGELYLDDGISLVQDAVSIITLDYTNGTLTTNVNGSYPDTNDLANITVAGFDCSSYHNSSSYSSSSSSDHSPNTSSYGSYGTSCDNGPPIRNGTTIPSNATTRCANGTLYITGLSDLMSSGAWSQNLTLNIA